MGWWRGLGLAFCCSWETITVLSWMWREAQLWLPEIRPVLPSLGCGAELVHDRQWGLGTALVGIGSTIMATG